MLRATQDFVQRRVHGLLVVSIAHHVARVSGRLCRSLFIVGVLQALHGCIPQRLHVLAHLCQFRLLLGVLDLEHVFVCICVYVCVICVCLCTRVFFCVFVRGCVGCVVLCCVVLCCVVLCCVVLCYVVLCCVVLCCVVVCVCSL